MTCPPGAAPRFIRRLRVLFAEGDRLFASVGRRVICSEDAGATWSSVAELRVPSKALATLARVRIAERLGRAEIYKLHVRGDRLVALAQGGVYAGSLAEGSLELSYRVQGGSRPISLCLSPSGAAFFGEYSGNPERGPVRIFGSDDLRSWKVVYQFPPGEVRHVRGVFFDPYKSCHWVLTGDYGAEPGILRASEDFSNVAWVRRGTQSVRAYSLVCRPEGLLFATDTEVEPNGIYLMGRDGSEPRLFQATEASSFHVGRFGPWTLFATVCEPSASNDSTYGAPGI